MNLISTRPVLDYTRPFSACEAVSGSAIWELRFPDPVSTFDMYRLGRADGDVPFVGPITGNNNGFVAIAGGEITVHVRDSGSAATPVTVSARSCPWIMGLLPWQEAYVQAASLDPAWVFHFRREGYRDEGLERRLRTVIVGLYAHNYLNDVHLNWARRAAWHGLGLPVKAIQQVTLFLKSGLDTRNGHVHHKCANKDPENLLLFNGHPKDPAMVFTGDDMRNPDLSLPNLRQSPLWLRFPLGVRHKVQCAITREASEGLWGAEILQDYFDPSNADTYS